MCAGAVRCLRESATRIISSHPLLNDVEIGGLGEKRREHAMVNKSVNPVQWLILEIPDARHKIASQPMTQGKDDLGISVGIRWVRTDLQNRVIFKQTIKDVEGLARAARNHLGAENGILIGDVSIDADGFLAITVISRVIGSQQAAGSDAEALGIGRGEGSHTLHGAQRQLMMPIHDFSTGGGECFLSHKVM